MIRSLFLALTLLSVASASTNNDESRALITKPAERVDQRILQKSNKEVVSDFVNALFVDFDTEALGAVIDPGYIQHNPLAATGAEVILGFVPVLQQNNVKIKVHRILGTGDLIAVHSTYRNVAGIFGEANVMVGFDVFRVENGLVAEHWDNLQPKPAEKNPSGRSMTDGPGRKGIKDKSEKTVAKNVAIIETFLNDVLIQGAFAEVPDFINPDTYKQHNPSVGDGLDTFLAFFATLAEAGDAFIYTKLWYVVAEGSFVLTLAEGTISGVRTAFYDLFRVKKGLIVEHWDVIQAFPAPDDFANENGKFSPDE